MSTENGQTGTEVGISENYRLPHLTLDQSCKNKTLREM